MIREVFFHSKWFLRFPGLGPCDKVLGASNNLRYFKTIFRPFFVISISRNPMSFLQKFYIFIFFFHSKWILRCPGLGLFTVSPCDKVLGHASNNLRYFKTIFRPFFVISISRFGGKINKKEKNYECSSVLILFIYLNKIETNFYKFS